MCTGTLDLAAKMRFEPSCSDIGHGPPQQPLNCPPQYSINVASNEPVFYHLSAFMEDYNGKQRPVLPGTYSNTELFAHFGRRQPSAGPCRDRGFLEENTGIEPRRDITRQDHAAAGGRDGTSPLFCSLCPLPGIPLVQLSALLVALGSSWVPEEPGPLCFSLQRTSRHCRVGTSSAFFLGAHIDTGWVIKRL